jgi:tetratricopeptide (TPR) repeat protein
MRKTLFIFYPILIGSFGMIVFQNNNADVVFAGRREIRPEEALSCSPAADGNIYADANGKFIRLLPGRGNHSYTISTSSDSAQAYFNQGLTMYYSYHMREAVASFKEAARFDSSCAMAYWGQALAMGPTFNFYHTYKMNAGLPAAINGMKRLADSASEKERDLIAAMNERYDVNDSANSLRSQLDLAYADAMRKLINKYSNDLDIKALYTDAVMLVHPWSFWNNDGRPKEWTPELVMHCEEILSRDPHHPGALHYYIHITEASRKPEVALPSADLLINLYPGIAHMVHMSSHEYERIGYYKQGVAANEKADRSLALYDSLAKGLYPQIHSTHYYSVDAYCAMSGNMYKKGVQKSLALRDLAKPEKKNHYSQYGFMYPALALVRMGKWEEILMDTTFVSPELSLSAILNHFAKGMASARMGKTKEAQSHLQKLRGAMKDEALKEKFAPHASSPYEVSMVAENLLLANILFEQKKYKDAIAAAKAAIAHEDQLLYAEPKMWLMPARQYLGAFLMHLKRPEEAEMIYREDLKWNPGNGWSLLGLYQALQVQGKTSELTRLKKMYLYSFSDAEVIPTASAY